MIAFEILQAYALIERLPYFLVAIAGVIGAILAATTRDDAYTAGDRQNKWIWVGLVAGSALVVTLPIPILPWAAMVIIGLYWFDVRPQLRNIISNSGGW
ncbi:DUF2516 family protein [Corynebacterium halotolerans]|uniref:DUF2516 family protein n=1 Tax=Corynebacterium halotolerans TaxID=225326 RepID=UPI003CF97E0C